MKYLDRKRRPLLQCFDEFIIHLNNYNINIRIINNADCLLFLMNSNTNWF